MLKDLEVAEWYSNVSTEGLMGLRLRYALANLAQKGLLMPANVDLVLDRLREELVELGFVLKSGKLQRGTKKWSVTVELELDKYTSKRQGWFDIIAEFIVEVPPAEIRSFRFSQGDAVGRTASYGRIDRRKGEAEIAPVEQIISDFRSTTLRVINEFHEPSVVARRLLEDELAPGVRNYLKPLVRARDCYTWATGTGDRDMQARSLQLLRNLSDHSPMMKRDVAFMWEMLEIPEPAP